MCTVNQNFYRENKMIEGIRTYLLIYSLEQSISWEPHRFSASQEIPPILWNQKIHYRIQKFPPRVQVRDTCSHFVTMPVFRVRRCYHLAQSQAGGPPLVSCPRLFIQYFRNYPPHCKAVPPSATCGRAVPWWQGPIYHGSGGTLQ
jgi:hypothetical protein